MLNLEKKGGHKNKSLKVKELVPLSSEDDEEGLFESLQKEKEWSHSSGRYNFFHPPNNFQ